MHIIILRPGLYAQIFAMNEISGKDVPSNIRNGHFGKIISIHPQSNAIVNEERPCHSLLSIIGRISRRVGSVRSAALHIQSNRIINTPK